METNREICRVITRMWAKGVLSGFDDMLPYSVDHAKEAESVLSEWRIQLDTLMGWLDWSVWVKCRPACGPEVCDVGYLAFLWTHVSWISWRWGRARIA